MVTELSELKNVSFRETRQGMFYEFNALAPARCIVYYTSVVGPGASEPGASRDCSDVRDSFSMPMFWILSGRFWKF